MDARVDTPNREGRSNSSGSQPFWKLRKCHRSTCVVVALVLVALIMANVPGKKVVAPFTFDFGVYGIYFLSVDQSHHGWPIAYLVREPAGAESGPPFAPLSLWNLSEGIKQFSPWLLIADCAIGLAISVSVAMLFEAWRLRRERLWQFSIRQLLMAATVVAAGFGFYSMQAAEYRKQQQILQGIKETENVTLELVGVFEERVHWQRGGPTWMRELIGDEPFLVFDRVAAIDTQGETLFPQIAQLTQLRVLFTRSDGATSEKLKLLHNLPHLEALTLVRMNTDGKLLIGAEDVQPIRLPHLPKLRFLSLHPDRSSVQGLENIPAVEVLDLSDATLDEQEFKKLTNLQRLRQLSLVGKDVKDKDLEYVAKLSNLKSLSLYDTSVDASGVRRLARLPRLRKLVFYGGEVSDAAIPAFKRLASLELLSLQETKVSDGGFDRLRTAMPNCDVHYDHGIGH